MLRKGLSCVAAAAVAAALISPGFGAEAGQKYQAYLSPMPHNDAMHANVTGKGAAVATLEGDTLTLNGTFTDLAGVATKAHVCLSKAPGIPGTPIFAVTVPPVMEGKVTGTFNLDKSQIAEFQKGNLYVQIDSEKAPNGNLWGWLLAEHEIPAQDVPQKGPWFEQGFAVKTK